ncbi:Fe-S-cluster containining protein [Parabacteroides sp. PFB2-12]|uniref:YkgJ family cysteine cluster protein n=1 Tax=unclassified Parabacteroides TaxID=2649774 RepID=UPI002475A306|nr:MULTISPECIES: YkgJ family cysteine cluster protein [unclassified Parabacteroides]MDH6341378.1 Fe-S-cluster containining protein [Parabacteroides sp. PM6-13]MDH6389172.1 Fe-S-cluster containining protein [Parabacteroides sp. PFB2-12]
MDLQDKAEKVEKETRQFFKNIKKNRMRELDDVVHALHEEAFEEIDCLACANCCRTLGPRLTDRDIERMASALRIKQQEVIARYLRIDEDNDYVFKEMPCPFLCADNYCSIYEDRPRACREYPHTDRKKFYQIYPLTIKNAGTCPAVFEILERLKKEF